MFQADELLLALREVHVRFVVIGGIAVGVHGHVRATKDLDITSRSMCMLIERADRGRARRRWPRPRRSTYENVIGVPLSAAAVISAASRTLLCR
jgi:hypothetical protein